MGSKIDGPSGPRPRFFIIGLRHFQRGIGYYTWLACKTDISEEVRSHQSNVTKRRDMTLDWWLLTSSEMSVLHASPNTTLKMTVQLWKIVVWDHSDHQFWTPYMWSMPLIDALLHSLWETNFFRKSQIEALWCPKSIPSSVICDRLVYWM